jgi:hypothetical protein
MPRGRTNGRSGEYLRAAENFGCVRERFLHLHSLRGQKAGLSRTADLYAKRSEGPQSARNVAMCLAQGVVAWSMKSLERALPETEFRRCVGNWGGQVRSSG